MMTTGEFAPSGTAKPWDASLTRRTQRLRPSTALGGLLVAAAVACAVVPGWIAPQDPNTQSLLMARRPPVWLGGVPDHVLGTDYVGRDVLSRLIYGARVSLPVSSGAVFAAAVFGGAMGVVAGSTTSRAGDLIMRLIDVQMAIPVMVMAIVLIGVLGPALPNLILVFALAEYPSFARIVRGETIQLREREFITAARAAGATYTRLIAKHLLPSLVGPVLAIATLEMPAVILYESGLGFLGLSVPPSIPSWGGMLADGRQYLTSAWWISIFAGLAIVSTIFGFNLCAQWAHMRFAPEIKSV